MGDKGRQSKIISAQHPDKAKSSQPSIQTCHGRQRETKQNHLSPASRHAMEDKARRRETKQNHLSPASRHAMGDKGRQREAQQRETKGDKAKSSQPSIQTCHGRQVETKGDKAKSSQPSIQTRHGRQGETRGDKGRESSWPASFLCPSQESCLGNNVQYKGVLVKTWNCHLGRITVSNHFGNSNSANHELHCMPLTYVVSPRY